MSSLTHIFGELDHPKIECQADEPCIWIRGRNDTVSLTLDRRQRDQLRAALDECDEFEKPVRTVSEMADIFTSPGHTLIAAALLANAFRKAGETPSEENARRLRTIRDDLEGAP
jgi:hypothetical protein